MKPIRLLAVVVAVAGIAAGQDPHGPLSPKDALRSLRVAAGFKVELVAAEPDVMDPVAMAFDENGRLFVDKIPYATGVMPWRGGVLVTAAPDIWFFKDTDGDGKADVREVVFSGFTEGNQQHRVNGLQFGLDNWIYGTNGDSGGSVRRGDTDGPKVQISGRDYLFKADYSGFEGVAGRGHYSNTFDQWGNRFIHDNSNHIRYPVP